MISTLFNAQCCTTQRLLQIFSQRRNKIARFTWSNSKYFRQLTEQGFFCVKMCSLPSTETATSTVTQKLHKRTRHHLICVRFFLQFHEHDSCKGTSRPSITRYKSIKLPLKLFFSLYVCPILNMADFAT